MNEESMIGGGQSVKLLGVHLDRVLISGETYKSWMKNVRKTVDKKVDFMAYHALFQPHCNYWGI